MSMTRDRAISLLRRYRPGELSPPKHYCLASWTMYEFGERVYTRYLVGELIRRLRCAPSSQYPMDIVQRFYWEIDEILVNSKNPITSQFTRAIDRIVGDILDYLWAEEDKQTKRIDMGELVRALLTKEESNVQL